MFVVIFLVPPFYMLMTSLKTSAEISRAAGSPWLVQHPTLDNFMELITDPNFQTFFYNSVKITVCVVVLQHGDLRSWPRSPGADAVLGQCQCSRPACS